MASIAELESALAKVELARRLRSKTLAAEAPVKRKRIFASSTSAYRVASLLPVSFLYCSHVPFTACE